MQVFWVAVSVEQYLYESCGTPWLLMLLYESIKAETAVIVFQFSLTTYGCEMESTIVLDLLLISSG